MRLWTAAALLPMAHLGGGFIQLGRDIAARNEQTRTSFRVLMGDVQAADALLNRLIDYAAHTPFELPQLFNVTQGLVAFGDRGDEVMETLKMLGDVSGGVHEKFQILGTVFNQIRGVGSLMSQDFKQLSIRGLLFITDLAKYLGVSKEQADRLQRSGKISFEDVRGTLMMLTQAGERFHNMMELQSQTILGLTATLKDNWGILASKIAEALIPLDRMALQLKIGLLDVMTDLVEATHGFAAGALVGATAAAKLGLALLGASLAAKLLGISLRTALVGTGWAIVIMGIGAALGGLVAWFYNTADGIASATGVSERLIRIWEKLKAAGIRLITSINEGFQNAFGVTIPGLLDGLSGDMAEFIEFVAGKFEWLIDEIIFIMDGLGFFFRNAWDLLAIGGLDAMIKIIEMAQTLEQMFYDVSTSIMKVFAGLWGYISAGFTNLINEFKAAGQVIIDNWVWLTTLLDNMLLGKTDVEAIAYANEAKAESERNGFQKPEPLDLLEEARKAAAAENGLARDGDPLLDETKKGLEEERKLLQDRINDRENKRRDDEEDKKEKENPKKGKPPAPPVPTDLIPAGRYGFIEFGQKIQDALLKDTQEQQGAQMIQLMGQGNNIQQQILNNQRRNQGLAP